MNSLRNALTAYRRILFRYPIGTQAVQTGILMGLADVIAQTAVEKKKFRELNKRRTLAFAGIGFFYVGPTIRIWYGALDKWFPQVPGTKLAYKKMLMDQLIFAPPFLMSLVSMIGLANGMSLSQVKKKIDQDFKDILITNYKVWPFVIIANFSLVPLQYQVLVSQIVSLFWSTYLSWKSNTSIKS